MENSELLNKADWYKNTISFQRPLKKEELHSLENFFKVEFTFSSNSLEGNTLTLSETKILLEDGITVGGKPLKDIYEAAGHAEAFDFMLKISKGNEEITEDVIIKLHYFFYYRIDFENAGKYRDIQVFISGSEHTVPTPENIKEKMGKFIDRINSMKNEMHPIEYAAMIHKGIVDIHPFIDGNGRTARLVMNLILVKNGYGIVSIPPVLRNEYIRVLENARKIKDSSDFIAFIAERVIETQKEISRLLGIEIIKQN